MLNREAYTGKNDKDIQSEAYRERMETFVDEQLNIESARRYIDWDALKWHHRQLPPQRQATRLKFVFRWAPTNARNVKNQAGR